MTPTITLPRATVEQALEVLLKSHTCPLLPDDCDDAITALRAALAQQAEPVEPVAWMQPRTLDGYLRPDLGYETCSKSDYGAFPVYTAPPQRKPLTEEEIDAVWDQWFGAYGLRGPGGPYTRRGFARAVERAHNITDPQIADRLARHGIPMPGDPK